MKFNLESYFKFAIFFSVLYLGGCLNAKIKPIRGLNTSLAAISSSYREPSLGNEWLVSLVNIQGKDKIEMIHIKSRRKIPLPGINRADSQPISVSVSANGERLAFIRQRADKTELLIYRRRPGTLQRVELSPKGIPRRVSLDGSGKILAVQVSRDGRWDIQVIRLKG